MKKCPKCGAFVGKTQEKCRNCGFDLLHGEVTVVLIYFMVKLKKRHQNLWSSKHLQQSLLLLQK